MSSDKFKLIDSDTASLGMDGGMEWMQTQEQMSTESHLSIRPSAQLVSHTVGRLDIDTASLVASRYSAIH